jgi:hypothetical protein
MYSIFYHYCRITCITGVRQGSVVSAKVFIDFAHREDRIESGDYFEFVVSFINIHFRFYVCAITIKINIHTT